ncbi:MAG: hypothetical protein ACETWR_15185 [Anaerolineae bacterium]
MSIHLCQGWASSGPRPHHPPPVSDHTPRHLPFPEPAGGTLNYGQGLAMSTLLMIACAVGFLAIERFRYGEVGEF